MADVQPKAGALGRLRAALTAGLRGFRDTYTGDGYLSPATPVTPRLPGPGDEPRVWPYQPGQNIYLQPRAELPTTFETLRAIAEVSDLIRIAIAHRKAQLVGMRWDIAAKDAEQTEARKSEIEAVRAFFQKPDRVHSWAEWMDVLLEDLFVIDALTLFRRRTRKGELYALDPIDGSTIKPLVDYWGRTPEPPLPAYQQYLYGRADSQYTTRELLYKPKNRRVHTLYGFSPVEWVLLKINMALRRDTFTLAHFTDGTMPEGFMNAPEDWTPQQLIEYQRLFDQMMVGRDAKRSRVTWVPANSKFEQTKEWSFDRAFDEWIARIIAGAFQVPVQLFEVLQNRATAEVGEEMQTDVGLRPLQLYVKGIHDQIIWEDLGFTDLHWVWTQDKTARTKDQVTKNVEYVRNGIFSPDEVRIDEGRKPIGVGNGIVTKSGFVPLEVAIAHSSALAAQAAAGHGGTPDDGEEEDDPAAAVAAGKS